MSYPQRRGRLGPRRAVRIRAFDGRHEVLHKRDMVTIINLESPALLGVLAGLLEQAVELAGVLENEPMDHPRIEVWCQISGKKLLDYNGGLI